MNEVGVFLGGEGRNELGGRSGHPTYQSDTEPGVIETLLRRVQPQGWRVVGARNWSQIRKLRARGPTPNEKRNVAALVLHAREAGAQVLAFVRDGDGDEERFLAINEALTAHESDAAEPDIIGGVAVPVLEGWLLSLQGEPGTESLSKAAALRLFFEKNGFLKDTPSIVQIAEQADLARIPIDATSLKAWLGKAKRVFKKRIP